MPKLLERIFHGFMVSLLLAIIFSLSGIYAFLKFGEDLPSSGHAALIVSAVGGLVGTVYWVNRYFSKFS